MSEGIAAGDRVRVSDPALDQLNQIMGVPPEMATNNTGIVDRVDPEVGLVYINFDEGGQSVYHATECLRLPEEGT